MSVGRQVHCGRGRGSRPVFAGHIATLEGTGDDLVEVPSGLAVVVAAAADPMRLTEVGLRYSNLYAGNGLALGGIVSSDLISRRTEGKWDRGYTYYHNHFHHRNYFDYCSSSQIRCLQRERCK